MITSAQIIQLLISFKYVVVFPMAVLEGPIVAIVCGFLVSRGAMSFAIVYPLLVIADVIGDVLYYALGYFGGAPVIGKWGKRFGVNEAQLMKSRSGFDRYGGQILLTGKLTHFAGAAVLIAAGVVQYGLGRFVWYNLIGTMIKSLLLVAFGFYCGYAYQQIAVYFDYVGLASSVITLAVIIAAFYYLSRRPEIR